MKIFFTNRNKVNSNFLVLILAMSALLLLTVNPYMATVKAQTQDSVYVYTSCGGTVSAAGTDITGGSTYNFTSGATITFSATPLAGFKFLCWDYAASSGSQTSTKNPFPYTISQTECAIQAMFIPDVNASLSSTSSQTGAAPFDVLASMGGTTTPGAATYTTYTIGTVVSFTANPLTGFKFLYWLVPAAAGGSSVSTDSTLAFNVTANACALQAYFIPTTSSVRLPTIKQVDEFSSVVEIIAATILVIITFGAYAHSRRSKK